MANFRSASFFTSSPTSPDPLPASTNLSIVSIQPFIQLQTDRTRRPFSIYNEADHGKYPEALRPASDCRWYVPLPVSLVRLRLPLARRRSAATRCRCPCLPGQIFLQQGRSADERSSPYCHLQGSTLAR